eukprot:scaffold45907_cov30-Cyclotella_meneghiniana.AAC.1
MDVYEMKTSQNSSTQQYELRFSLGFHNLVPIVFYTATAWPWHYFLSIIIMSSDAKDGQHFDQQSAHYTSLFLHDEEMVVAFFLALS